MAKQFNGIVTAVSTKDTVLVEVTRRTAHPLYRKLITRSKVYKVDTREKSANVGDAVTIIETRPISKDKHFKLGKVITEKKASTGNMSVKEERK